jgi:hypothetical protein
MSRGMQANTRSAVLPVRISQPSAGDSHIVAAGALQRLRIPNRIGLIALAMRDNVRMHNGRGAR